MSQIIPQELKAKLENGEIFELVDIRDSHSYGEKHIPGASNVPAGEKFVEMLAGIVPDKEAHIILYNDRQEDPSDKEASAALESAGYIAVATLPDGLTGWMNAGYQVEGGQES